MKSNLKSPRIPSQRIIAIFLQLKVGEVANSNLGRICNEELDQKGVEQMLFLHVKGFQIGKH